MSKHFLDLSAFSLEKLSHILNSALDLKAQKSFSNDRKNHSIALIFFEPSTRTRMSFELAAHREGFFTSLFDGGKSTSLEKGETLEDTLLNIAAMNFSALVVRSGENLNLTQISQQISTPILNAGWGKSGHPSQALLDLMTMKEQIANLKDVRLLMVGDIAHSRVASSHFQASSIFGYQIACCGPENLIPKGAKSFANLQEGLKWANVVMALRIQFERHIQIHGDRQESYDQQYTLTTDKLKSFSADGIIMHPGPVNYGIEIAASVTEDSRNRILNQVSNGVFVRRALIQEFVK